MDAVMAILGNYFAGGVPDAVVAGIEGAIADGAGAVTGLLMDAGLSAGAAEIATDAIMLAVAI